MYRVCKYCDVEQPLEDFVRAKGRTQYYCKCCAYFNDNPEFYAEVIRTSKSGDKHYNRYEEKGYIDTDHLMALEKAQNMQCEYCDCVLDKNFRQSPDGWTVQRIEYSLGHTKDNTILCCFTCNVISQKHITHEMMLEHGWNFKEGYTKYCACCKEIKSTGCFNRDKTRRGGFHGFCRLCQNLRDKKYYTKRRKRNKDCAELRARLLATIWETTLEDYEAGYENMDKAGGSED